MKQVIVSIISAIVFITSCGKDPGQAQFHGPISLEDLVLGEDLKRSGRRLIKRQKGFHPVKIRDLEVQDTAYVAIHGYGSEGYEWIYPLRRMAQSGFLTLFYRYDWGKCPEDAAEDLYRDLKWLLLERPQIKKLVLFSHSYGGIVTTELAEEYALPVLLDVHTVASPLGGYPGLGRRCDWEGFPADGIFPLNDSTQHFQWRTQYDQDGAFRKLDHDPQVIDLKRSQIVLLPDSTDGIRLGHNRSISWVMDAYFE